MLVLSWDINGIWCRIESEIGLVFKYLKNQTPFKGENVICQATIYSQQIVGSLKSMDYKKTGFDGICANATKNDSRLCDLVSPTVLDRPCITLSSSSWGVGYARQTVQQKNKWYGTQCLLVDTIDIIHSVLVHNQVYWYQHIMNVRSWILSQRIVVALPSFPFTRQNLDVWLGKESLAIHIQKYYITLKLKSWIIWELRVDSQLPPQPFLMDQIGWIHVFFDKSTTRKDAVFFIKQMDPIQVLEEPTFKLPRFTRRFHVATGFGMENPRCRPEKKKTEKQQPGSNASKRHLPF